jgi:hypothetical protein
MRAATSMSMLDPLPMRAATSMSIVDPLPMMEHLQMVKAHHPMKAPRTSTLAPRIQIAPMRAPLTPVPAAFAWTTPLVATASVFQPAPLTQTALMV